MKKKNSFLSDREEALMELLWASETPLSAMDLQEQLDSSEWSRMTLYRTLQLLIEKGYVRICGLERNNTQYMRKMEAAITKSGYLAKELINRNFRRHDMSGLVMALIEETQNISNDDVSDNSDLIADLENIISDIKKRSNDCAD